MLTGDDGLFTSASTRLLPAVRPPLVPEKRWAPPADIMAGTWHGKIVALYDTDIGMPGTGPWPASGRALPRWRVALHVEAIGNAAGAHELELQYLEGPEGTEVARVLLNGTELRTLDTRGEEWAVRTVHVPVPSSVIVAGTNILELVDADGAPSGREAVPSGFFVAGVALPDALQARGHVSMVLGSGGESFALPLASAGQPVRLWTVGVGDRTHIEFVPVEQSAVIEKRTPRSAEDLLTMIPARELPHTVFSIERNPDGSQVEDFRQASPIITTPTAYNPQSEFSQAGMQTIVFDSPVAGKGSLVGLAVMDGAWHLVLNGERFADVSDVRVDDKSGGKKWRRVRIENLPIRAGENRLTFSVGQGRIEWDWFGLDLNNSDLLASGTPSPVPPLARPVAKPRVNRPIIIDPGVVISINGETTIRRGIWGMTDHSQPDGIRGNVELERLLRELDISFVKGPDHLISDTSPQQTVTSPADLDTHYQSAAPLNQYKTLWGEERRHWKQNLWQVTSDFGWNRIAVLSGIPAWAQFPGGKGFHNGVPADIDVAAGLVGRGVEYARNVLGYDIQYGYLWNEPDAWWRYEKDIQATAGLGHTAYFRKYLKAAAREIRARVPDFQIGVPSTYAPPVNFRGGIINLDKWENWWAPLLRESWADFDFFDFHAYGFDPRQILANLDVLAAAGETLHGERKPVFMTEVGYAESLIQHRFDIQSEPWSWRYRALPYTRFLAAVAGEPDRLTAALYYDLCNHEYGMFRIGGMEPTSLADVFRLTAPFRGLLLGADSADADMTWVAARDEATVRLLIVTGERNGGSIPIVLPKEHGGRMKVHRLSLNERGDDVILQEDAAQLVDGTAILPASPGSVILATWALDEEAAGRALLVRKQKEFFANGFVVALNKMRRSVTWELPCSLAGSPGDWSLRISAFGPATMEELDFRWNGVPVAGEGKYRGEIALPAQSILAKNQLEVKLPDKKHEDVSFVLGAVSLIHTAAPEPLKSK